MKHISGLQKSLNDFTPYWDIYEDIVFLEDGRMEFGVEFTPPNRLFLTSEKQESMHLMVKNVLQMGIPVGERGRVYIRVDQAKMDSLHKYRDLPYSKFEIVNRMCEARYEHLEQLRRRGEIKNWTFVMTCTMKAPVKFGKDAPLTPEEIKQCVHKAKMRQRRLVSTLKDVGYEARAMTEQDLFAFMDGYWNGGSSARPPRFIPIQERGAPAVNASGEEDPLTLKRQLFRSRINNERQTRIIVADRYVAVVALSRMPTSTTTGMIQRVLERMNSNSYYIVLEFEHEDPGKTMDALEDQKNKYFALQGDGVKAAKNTQAVTQLSMVQETIESVTRTADHAYVCSVSVILMSKSEDELELDKEECKTVLNQFPGAGPINHDFQSVFNYFALAPFNGKKAEFHFKMLETNCADLFPPIAPWSGMDTDAFPMRNRTDSLTWFDLFSGGTSANHFAFFAPTGYGKTFAIQSLLIHMLRKHQPIISIVDRKNDYEHLTRLVGGAVIPFAPGTQINPMDLPEGAKEPDEGKEDFLYALVRYFVPPSSDSREAGEEKPLIIDGIKLTYRRMRNEPIPPVLSDLQATLASMGVWADGAPLTEREKMLARSIASRMRPYLKDSSWGKILDRQTNVDTTAHWIYYDLSAIPDAEPEKRKIAMHVVQDRIWKTALERGQNVRKMAVISEFGSQITTEDDKKFVSTSLRLARSFNLAIGIDTQTVDDLKKIEGLEESFNYIFLGNLSGGEDVLTRMLKFPQSIVGEMKTLTRTSRHVEWIMLMRKSDKLFGEIIKFEETRYAYWALTSEPNEKHIRDTMTKKHGSLIRAIEAIVGGEM